MAVESDKRTRWLGIPGMVLGICICLTVIIVANIVRKDGSNPAQETLKELTERVGALEPKVDKQAHDIRVLQDSLQEKSP